jgi:class 3 adenylate cyclase/tetratricopeptide (TPR) repeat protein
MREQRKVVTVLFCDLVGSTALGESTDPEVVRARLTRMFEDLRSIVERHGGSVEKFIGDAVMAVFGVPTAHEDDALRAVRAACEMRDAVASHDLEARIGVNTGEVVVGGEGETLVTGDAVNVAARLEQAAAAGETLIGEPTRALVRDAVRVDAVEPLVLKGKATPVQAYRLFDVIADEPVARRLETPLVGRAREQTRLRRDYEDAVADRTCRLFTLLGPAGIGKSRLVADFLARVGESADVLRGRCLSYGEGITYWPLVEMLSPIGVEPESVVLSTPEETRVAFRKLLESRAAERPQIVVIDDLQWAEPAFVDLVEHVADHSRDAPIFLLCIARTELLDTRPGWAGGKLNATSLQLEPLEEDECVELMRRQASDATLDLELLERIAVASAGNPLFVEEMLAMVRERGERAVDVPPTIQVLLQARIDALDADARTLLECGAVEGEVFHRSAIAELVPDALRADLENQLASLVRRDLIRSTGSLIPGEDAYRFRHVLLRDAAYSAMPKEARATLHERFADWLDGSAVAPAFERGEILGYHYEQAYRLRAELGSADGRLAARAGSRLVPAGQAALERADLTAAKGLLERGIDLLPGEDPVRLVGMLDLARVLARLGELERSERVLGTVIAEAQSARDVPAEARARLVLTFVRFRLHPEFRTEEGLREALELAATLERADDRAGVADAYTRIGMHRFMLGHGGEGRIAFERAAVLAREAGDEAVERAALASNLRPIAYGPTPAEEGIAFCDSLAESDVVNVADKAHALQVRALLLAMAGDFDGSRSSSVRARALIEEFELTLQRGIYAIDVGLAELVAGDLDRSERELREGHDLLVEIGDTGVRSSLDAILSDVLFLLGRDDEALVFAEASRTAGAIDDLDSQPRWRGARARVLARRGEHEEALELVGEALALLEPTDFIGQHAYVCDVHGEVLTASGRPAEAVAAVERAIAFHEQKGNVVSAARSRAVLDELRTMRPS